MKRIVQNIYFFFIFMLGVIFVATYFFYRYTSTEFLEKRAANNLTMITETVSETLSYKIDSDYRKLEKYLENKEYTDIDETSLGAIFTEEISFGRLLSSGLEYKGENLVFNEEFAPGSTIINAVSVVRFNVMIADSSDDNIS